jgi:purine-nucleoside phosphorylase
MKPGSLCLITNHLKYLCRVDPFKELNETMINEDNLNEKSFWDEELSELGRKSAKKLNIELFEGIYVKKKLNERVGQVDHLTKHQMVNILYIKYLEIQFGRKLNVAVVGMSTAPEIIIAKACGLKVFGLSLATNLAAGSNTIQN